jgi:hypothetical protein
LCPGNVRHQRRPREKSFEILAPAAAQFDAPPVGEDAGTVAAESGWISRTRSILTIADLLEVTRIAGAVTDR